MFNTEVCTGSIGQAGNMVESILELSLCDYLLIPDTTFSGWASFIRDVPIFLVTSKTQKLSLESTVKADAILGFKNKD